MLDLSDANLMPYALNRLVGVMNKKWLMTLRRKGLTIPRWQVLSILSARQGFRIQDLADMIAVDQPVLTRVVDQMVRDGLVERHVNPIDSRSRLVKISDQGLAIFLSLLPDAEKFVETLFGNLAEQEKATMMNMLTRLMSNMEPEKN